MGGRGENFPYAGAIDAATSFGADMQEMDVNEVCTDFNSNIITTPAYMQSDASPHAVFDGIQNFLRKVSSRVSQKVATQNQEQRQASSVGEGKRVSEDDLMMRLVN